jgi:hypothetical protein
MKTASAATLAILAAGEYLKIEFWRIQLTSGQTYYFTDSDAAPITVGGNTYVGGLIFVRDEITQKCGTEVNSLDMTISPQFDYPGGQPLIGGGTFLSQLRAGAFDNAVWTMYKGFFNRPTPGNQLNVSPGIVPWWQGITSTAVVGRQTADVTLDDTLSVLANQQMPRNMVQQSCIHRLGDVGCTVPLANNTYSGAITSVLAGNIVNTNLTPSSFANGFFSLGVITFTSGVLNGSKFTVSLSQSSSGQLTTIMPFPSAPSVGDTFTIIPGCDKTFATCGSGKFKNSSNVSASFTLHYRGYPFVPQPETLYDGGTGSQTLQTQGSQGTPGMGSPFTGLKSI